MATSMNRITGLATGLDIDSIVKSSMMNYQNKIDKVYKQKSLAEIKQQLYRDVIKEGQNFYNKYFDITKSGNLVSPSTFSSTSFISSNDAVATAIGSSSALKSNYTISVNQMAKAAKVQLTADDLGFTKDPATNKFTLSSDLQISGGDEATTVLISKDEFNDANITSEKDLAKFINSKANAAGFKVYTSDFTSDKITIETRKTGSNQNFTIKLGTIKGEHVNGSTGTLSISDLLEKDAQGNYLNNKDMEVTFGNETIVIRADTLRAAISDYTDNKNSVSNLKNHINDTILGKDYLDGLKSVRSYLNSAKAAVSEDDPNYATKVAEFDSKIETVANIIGRFDSADSITLTPAEKTLLNSESNNAIAYDEAKSKSTIKETLDSILKGAFGTTDSAGEHNKVIATVNDSGQITLSNGVYKVGSRVYAQVEGGSQVANATGSDLKASITGPNGTITYGDGTGGSIVQHDNSLVVDGASITINSEGTDASPVTATLTAKTDVTAMKDKIVKFVNDYNEYVTKLNTLLTEKRYRDYEPLTEEQKKDMKDTEIEAWEKKVKSGQLRGDSDLQRVRDSLVDSMTSMVSGAGITLNDIGISLVQSYGTTKDGTFSIDEEKLTKALEDKTEEVANLFTQKGDTMSKTGIAQRMKNSLYDQVVSTTRSSIILKSGMEGTTSATTSSLPKLITEYSKKLEDLKKWYKTKEQALYSKWANIETIMNNYNSQASYLSSMFNSGS